MSEVINISKHGTNTSMFRELRDFRELLFFFTWRDIKVRYKQTALGMLWVILQPLVLMGIVQMLLLKRLGNDFGAGEAPAYMMLLIGFTFWQFFEGSFANVINSFVSNSGLFGKIYFPKVLPAVSSILSRLVDFSMGIVMFILVAVVFQHDINFWGLLMLIPLLLIMGLAAFGAGLFFGTLNVCFSDLKQVLPFVIRMLFITTPIFWPLSILPVWAHPIMYLNPGTAGIQTFREAMYAPENIKWSWLLIPLATMLMSLLIGVKFFRKREKEFIDIV